MKIIEPLSQYDSTRPGGCMTVSSMRAIHATDTHARGDEKDDDCAKLMTRRWRFIVA